MQRLMMREYVLGKLERSKEPKESTAVKAPETVGYFIFNLDRVT
jgi:hypothetical protein